MRYFKYYKYLQVQKKTNSLSNDESQNTFVYHPTLDTLELTKDKDTDCVLS